jgi:hypothetical protein
MIQPYWRIIGSRENRIRAMLATIALLARIAPFRTRFTTFGGAEMSIIYPICAFTPPYPPLKRSFCFPSFRPD